MRRGFKLAGWSFVFWFVKIWIVHHTTHENVPSFCLHFAFY
uniref:Uncharacterized protein n=1 Tax=Arundo donax TaxID=35708 RepID=A0A0A9FZQ3_ARUDO